MGYGITYSAKCPHCGKKSNGWKAIETHFGYHNDENGRWIPNSKCLECEKKENVTNYEEIEYAVCPHCPSEAYGRSAIRSIFGYRMMANGEIIPQSWCRSCRKKR